MSFIQRQNRVGLFLGWEISARNYGHTSNCNYYSCEELHCWNGWSPWRHIYMLKLLQLQHYRWEIQEHRYLKILMQKINFITSTLKTKEKKTNQNLFCVSQEKETNQKRNLTIQWCWNLSSGDDWHEFKSLQTYFLVASMLILYS